MTDDRPVGVTLAPDDDCRRLEHPIRWLEVASGSGDRVEHCVLCSGAWAMAIAATDDEQLADAFVAELRAEATPWNESQSEGDPNE